MLDDSTPKPMSFGSVFNKDQNRRYLPRWEINTRVLYRKKGEDVYRECLSKDLSGDGVCIYLNDPLLNTDTLSIAVYISSEIAVEVTGKIAWRFSLGDRTVLGIKFENVTQKASDMIVQYIFGVKKEALTKNWFEGWK